MVLVEYGRFRLFATAEVVIDDSPAPTISSY